jgi:hypothetical protein
MKEIKNDAKSWSENLKRKSLLGWEDDTKMDLKDIVYVGVVRIHVA